MQIYDCNGTISQQWFFSGLELKVRSNSALCLDASGGLNQGTGIFIHTCNGGANQRWVAGTNDFVTARYFRVYAKLTGNISGGLENSGHAFLTLINDFNGLTNTVSGWGNFDNDDVNSNNTNRFNNIADSDNVFVDATDDWSVATNMQAGWAFRTYNTTKKLSDVYRYNAAYRHPYPLASMEYIISPNIFSENIYTNCARQTTRIARYIMKDNGLPYGVRYTILPSIVHYDITN